MVGELTCNQGTHAIHILKNLIKFEDFSHLTLTHSVSNH